MRSGRLSRTVFATSIIAALAVFAASAVSGASSATKPAMRFPTAPSLPPYLSLSGKHPFIGQHIPAGLFANRAKAGASTAAAGRVGTAQTAGPNPDTDITPGTLASNEIDPSAAPSAVSNSIVFASNGVDLDKNFQIDPTIPPTITPHYHVWIMRPDGSNQIQVTSGAGDEREPCYDPGGRWIAFTANSSGLYQIYTINLNTQAIYQITSGAGNKRHPTYSLDGNYIAYASDESGTPHIYKILAAGGAAAIQLTSGTGETEPTWSGSANLILFTGQAGLHTRIFKTDDQGTAPEQFSNGGNDPNADDQDPAWSPTGSSIGFASSRKTSGLDANINFNIWQMTSSGEISGGDAVLITDTDETTNATNIHPSWLPANDRLPIRLVWSSNRSDATRATYDVWIRVNTDTTPPLLIDKPSIDGPRQTTPGADVTIHVPIYDADSGVASVRAVLRNPDQKIWADDPLAGWGGLEDPTFDDSFMAGTRKLEYDCAQVGSCVMTDDGDPSNGDTTAGDGIFSGVFTTATNPHDYIIDIVVQDNAGNSFTYDHVYGFTTVQFAASTNILFVDDYCEGQKFLYNAGNNNMFPAGWPNESYWRSNPGTYSGIGNIDYDSLAGAYNMGYDVWRILCRGPVPQQVYQYYLPTVEYQLDPTEAVADPVNATATRRVLVADRCVVWAASHSGDVFTGSDSGDILDAATQSDLGLFLDRGGRVLIGGENIAWALTLNGSLSNDFLTRYLHANFVSDTPIIANYYVFKGSFEWQMLQTGYGFTLTGFGGPATAAHPWDPVSNDPWANGAPISAIHGDNYDADDRPIAGLNSPRIPPPNAPAYTDCSEFSLRPDIIAPTNTNEALYDYGTSFSYANTTAAAIRYQDPTSGAKVIYFAFGFEQLNRRYHTVNNYSHSRNFRSHILHNACCWMRTGGFQGKVVSLSNGGKPISTPPYPIVLCREGGSTVTSAVRVQPDGTFVVNGLQPDFYTLDVSRPGYSVQHFDGAFIHGGLGYVPIDFSIKLADPGAISGVVTSAATGAAINNATVSVQAVPVVTTNPDGSTTTTWPGSTTSADWPKTFTTAADGTYTASNLPPGDYAVTADGTAVGYGTEGPETVTVTANNVTHQDFQLPAANGTVVALVTDANTSLPILGATVRVKSSSTTVGTGTTDNTGTVHISVQPGTYSVTADAAGYGTSAPQTVTVVALQSTNPPLHFIMTPQPAGVVTGRVISAVSGLPVGGVQVLLIATGQTTQSTTTSGTFQSDAGGPQYNFKFASAPAGTVVIEPQPIGFSSDPSQTSVTVVSGALSANIVFKLNSLHTFATGLQLLSLPGDYTALDPANIFRLPAGQSLRLAAFEATRQQYALYPNAPADRIRPGVGYWLFLNGTSDLTTTGGNVTSPVSVPLYATWNLVGDPYTSPIDIFSAQVFDPSTGITYDWQTARQRGYILSSLWAYVIGAYQPSGSLNPYIGYWVACSRPLTMLINNTGTAAVVAHAKTAGLARPASGWGLALTVKCGSASDANTYLGVASSASDNFDPGLDELKPPTPMSGPFVAASAVADGAAADRSRLAVDMRPKAGETYKVRVETDQLGSPVTITWPDLSGLPSGVRPILVDAVAGKSLYMRTASGYTFTARESVRDLQITLQSSGSAPMAVSALQATPAGGSVNIVYTLSAAATVDIQVMNMSGLPVRTLASGGVATAGRNSMVWDGHNDRGSKVPAGRYLVLVRALSDNGEQTRAVTALQLGR